MTCLALMGYIMAFANVTSNGGDKVHKVGSHTKGLLSCLVGLVATKSHACYLLGGTG